MLHILSAPPGAGKSFLTRGLPSGVVVSSDAIREQVLGGYTDADGIRRLYPQADAKVFAIMEMMVAARVEQGLPTVVDATNLTDADRKPWVDIATRYGVGVEVLILDVTLNQTLAGNASRPAIVPEKVVRQMWSKFATTSVYPYRLVGRGERLNILSPRELPFQGVNVDVVGDVHGMRGMLEDVVAKAGWQVTNGVLTHPEGRHLVLLGDYVDRGPDSIGVLRLLKRSVEAGTTTCLMGNHEDKLLALWRALKAAPVQEWTSWANAQTGMDLLRLPREEADGLMQFVARMPTYLVHPAAGVVFAHADIPYFSPLVPRGMLLRGTSKRDAPVDTDAEYEAVYQELSREQLAAFTLIRGHIRGTSEQEHVFSLENHAFAVGGTLNLLRLDAWLEDIQAGGSPREAYARVVLSVTNEGYQFSAGAGPAFVNKMTALANKKLVSVDYHGEHPLRLFKYSRKCFWENAWADDAALHEARGVVVDLAGNIVVNPFSKVFNYGENGAGKNLAMDTPVVLPTKLNGFLGNVVKHPFEPNQLLVTTQGSFGADRVGGLGEKQDYTLFVREFLTPEVRGRVLKYLSRNNVTLMFEVLHPSDPHIVRYDPENYGLHLIGVRPNQFGAAPLTEHLVDTVAREIGLRRPSWVRVTFGEALRLVKDCQHEGFMVRADTEQQEFLLKLKSPYYLVVKFLGRLSEGKVNHLFSRPENFKRQVDEEIYPVVDAVVGTWTKDEFLSLPLPTRVTRVRELVDQTLM